MAKKALKKSTSKATKTSSNSPKIEAKPKKDNYRSGLFIPAGIFLGMGFGFLLNNLVAYLFIGLGVGFVLMFLTRK